MTYFDNSHFAWNERKMPFLEVWVSPVLMQNPDIWNFHGSSGVLRPGSLRKIIILVLNGNASLDSF